jgi:monoamine oxidase
MGLQAFFQYLIQSPILFIYELIQWVLDKVLSPTPPPPQAKLKRPKIAVIGAGLTGVSAASHIVGHGFDCHIFEAGPKENLGGIWSVSYISNHNHMILILSASKQYLRPSNS